MPVIEEDMQVLVVLLQHLDERVHRLGVGAYQAGRGHGRAFRCRSRGGEERIEPFLGRVHGSESLLDGIGGKREMWLC